MKHFKSLFIKFNTLFLELKKKYKNYTYYLENSNIFLKTGTYKIFYFQNQTFLISNDNYRKNRRNIKQNFFTQKKQFKSLKMSVVVIINKFFWYNRTVQIIHRHEYLNFDFDICLLSERKGYINIRFFNFDQNITLDFLANRHNNVFKSIEYIEKSYNTLITFKEPKEKYILEKFVYDSRISNDIFRDNCKTKTFFDNIYTMIFDNLSSQSIKNSKSISDYSSISKYYNEYVSQFVDNLNPDLFCDLEIKYPLAFQHGDHVLSNFLFYENEYYIIDFEHSGLYFFFYDLIFLIIGQDWLRGGFRGGFNNVLIKEYLLGGFDDHIRDIFKLYNLDKTFDIQFRYELIVLTMLQRRIIIDQSYELNDYKQKKQIERDVSFINSLHLY